jgi:LPXTG-motif cell wall-anchored protein
VASTLTVAAVGLVAVPLMVADATVSVDVSPGQVLTATDAHLRTSGWPGCSPGFTLDFDGVSHLTYTLAQPSGRLVIRAGTWDFVWTGTNAGPHGVPQAPDGKVHAISHVVVCGPGSTPSASASGTASGWGSASGSHSGSGTGSGTPSTGTPSTGTPSGTPSTGTPSGTPSTGTPSGTPSTGTPSGTPSTGTPSTSSGTPGTPPVTSTAPSETESLPSTGGSPSDSESLPDTGGTLPHTGSDPVAPVLAALSLLAVGGIVLASTRRRGVHL